MIFEMAFGAEGTTRVGYKRYGGTTLAKLDFICVARLSKNAL